MKRFNAYQYTDEFVKQGIEFLRSNRESYPPELRPYPVERERFAQRYENFVLLDNNTALGVTTKTSTLRVVPMSDIQNTLTKLYEQLGDIGRDRFYALIKQKYVGISRRQVWHFLENQELHQLLRPVKRQKVSRPIVASEPMERWQVDLVDVQKYKSPQNHHTTFLLTCIDCFSKYTWVVPLTNKSGPKVANAMRVLFHENGAPRYVQSDNGSEFLGPFDAVLEEHGVKHIKSNAFHPQSNGQIERFNGTLKRQIHAYMMSHGNTKTYVPVLPMLVSNYNDIPHTATGMSPRELHNSTDESNKSVQARLQKRAVLELNRAKPKYEPTKLAIGDHVRLAKQPKGSSFSSKKSTNTHWSKELHTVEAVSKPTREWTSATYTLSNGRVVTRDKLQKVDREALVRIPTRVEVLREARQQRAPPVIAPPRAPSTRPRKHNVRLEGYWA